MHLKCRQNVFIVVAVAVAELGRNERHGVRVSYSALEPDLVTGDDRVGRRTGIPRAREYRDQRPVL
jgi:hypothetical protein